MTSTPEQVIAKIREALEAGPYEGPWTVEEFQHDCRPCALIVSAEGTIIAEIRGYIDSCGNGENARFIAACNPQNIAVLLAALQSAADTPAPQAHDVVASCEENGFAAGIEQAARVAERYDETDTLLAPKAIATAIRAIAVETAMEKSFHTGNDDLTDCFRHHITTTIGWLAFGARPGPEMQMYEGGFKAGYRRCQSDNESEFGEEEDALSARARAIVGKLRKSIDGGAVQIADVEDAIDLIVDQSANQDAGTPAYWVRFRVSDGKATFWETEVPDGFPLYRRSTAPQPGEAGISPLSPFKAKEE